MKKTIPIILILISMFATQSCKKTSEAELVVDDFYSCIEKNDFGGILDLLAEEALEDISEDVVVETLKDRNDYWGKLKDRKKTFTEIKTADGGSMVILRYDVENENGETIEEFVLQEKEGTMKIISYEYEAKD